MKCPDLGQHLFNQGHRPGQPLILLNCRATSIATAPKKGRLDVTFFLTLGEDWVRDQYCGTVNTGQSLEDLSAILDLAKPAAMLGGYYVMVEGTLDRRIVRGQGGERFRMILGRVSPNLDPQGAHDGASDA